MDRLVVDREPAALRRTLRSARNNLDERRRSVGFRVRCAHVNRDPAHAVVVSVAEIYFTVRRYGKAVRPIQHGFDGRAAVTLVSTLTRTGDRGDDPVEAYLANQHLPLVGDAFPDAPLVAVNSPFV